MGDPNVAASRLHWLILDVGVRRPHQPWAWPDWLLLALVELLQRHDVTLDRSLPSAQRSVELFLRGLEERCGERWTLPRMAEECALGRSRFAHYCTRLTNMTPIVTEVAHACGFDTSQYFATVFRAHTGVTPSAYRAGRGGAGHG